jgi:hypothetical protein
MLTAESKPTQELTLLGGPLYRLGCRLGLVREQTNTIPLGIALGLLAWVVLLLLAVLEGAGLKLFSLSYAGVHVRFVIAIPLMFLCETWISPTILEFSRYIVRSGLVPAPSLPALASLVGRVGRMKDSWVAESLFLLAALGLLFVDTIIPIPGNTVSWASVLHSTGGRLPWTTGWYLGFCLPLYRFLLLRWLWRLGLWWYFLWRLGALDLNLMPTHSDRTAGLGYLEVVHENFAPLILSVSAICSAQFAEEISSGRVGFEALFGWVPILMLVIAALLIAPLFMFCSKLWTCRYNGLSKYMSMASHYVTAFDRKWIRDETPGESQLGTGDLQSLADLTNSLNVVRRMRWIPIGQRQLIQFAASAIVPLLPLLLLKFPMKQVAASLFQMLMGM